MADETGVASSIFDLAGEPVSDEARVAIEGYLVGHQRGRLGRIATSAEMFGLDEDDMRARFSRYADRFLA